MSYFLDNTGVKWPVKIDVSAIKRVKKICDIDLLETATGGEKSQILISLLFSDPILVCDIAYAVCLPDAEKAGYSDEYFGSLFSGETIEQARDAILESLQLFFPSQTQRLALKKLIAILRKAEKRLEQATTNYLASEELEQKIEKTLSTLGDIFIPSRDTSE